MSAYQRVIGWYERCSQSDTCEDYRDFDGYEEGAKLFKRLLSNGRAINPTGVNGSEETWERVILAEKFRQELMQLPPIFQYEHTRFGLNMGFHDDRDNNDGVNPVELSNVERNDTLIFEMNAYIEFVRSMSHLHRSRHRSLTVNNSCVPYLN